MRQQEAQFVHIQEVAGLLGGTIASMMVTLASVRQRLQETATDPGPELASEMVFASEVVLAIKELDCMISTRLGYALHLIASSFNSKSAVSTFFNGKQCFVQLYPE